MQLIATKKIYGNKRHASRRHALIKWRDVSSSYNCPYLPAILFVSRQRPICLYGLPVHCERAPMDRYSVHPCMA